MAKHMDEGIWLPLITTILLREMHLYMTACFVQKRTTSIVVCNLLYRTKWFVLKSEVYAGGWCQIVFSRREDVQGDVGRWLFKLKKCLAEDES